MNQAKDQNRKSLIINNSRRLLIDLKFIYLLRLLNEEYHDWLIKVFRVNLIVQPILLNQSYFVVLLARVRDELISWNGLLFSENLHTKQG